MVAQSFNTGLPSSVCVVGSAFIMGVSVYQYAKLKPKVRSFKTEEYEIKTHKIVAMCFDLCFYVYFGELRLAKAMFSK